MRGRPKIKLARTYEEATAIYDRYREHILSIVSNMSFTREGKKDMLAGYRFGQYVRETGPVTPIIMESSESSNREYARKLGASFIDKNLFLLFAVHQDWVGWVANFHGNCH